MLCVTLIIFSVLSTTLARPGKAATDRHLGVKPQLERKDTRMLDLQYPLYGPYAWDIPHQNMSDAGSNRCIEAVVSMVASYYGGNLSQDRIDYHVFHEVLNYTSPEDDLGDPAVGVIGLHFSHVLEWALNGASVIEITGKPDFGELKNWIDFNHPIISDGGFPIHLFTVIDGYDTEGQMVYVIDPITGNESKVPYDSLNVYVVLIPASANVTPLSDESTIGMDSDADGVVDFDEINRFHTDPYNNDTYSLGINDKKVIQYTYMEHITFPTATFKCSPQPALTNEQITFDASGSNGNITSYTWKFGDENVTTLKEPTVNHGYSQSGVYNVTLTVKDANDLWNTTCSLVTIIQDQNVSGTMEAFYRQSLDRTGYAPTEGPETPEVLWTLYLNDSVTTSPTVADRKVFVGTSSGKLYALDVTTGHVVWTFDSGSPISSSQAFQDGVVFFGTENPGKICAVNASTGLLIWSYEVPNGAAVYSSPAVAHRKVIAGSSNGGLYCLNQGNGQLLWTTQLGGGYLSSPAIQNDTVYVTSSLGVHAIDMLTGELTWEYVTQTPVKSCPAVADGLVFVGAEDDDRAYALDQSTGNLVWSFWTGGWLTPPAVDSLKNLVIIGSKDFNLYCLEEHTGYLKWAYINGPNYLSAPTISGNGLVYVGTSDGSIRSVNETTGEEVWEYNITSPTVSSLTLIDGHVLAGTQEGRIYCFGPPFPMIAVSDLIASKSVVARGWVLQTNATVENQGDSSQTFNMTIYANETAIVTNEMTLMNGSSATATFAWNTTGFAYGNYITSIRVWSVLYEVNTNGNNYTQTVHVGVPGDISGSVRGTQDGIVNMRDIAYLISLFNTNSSSPNWDSNADVNGDGVVNMRDVALAIAYFNQNE